MDSQESAVRVEGLTHVYPPVRKRRGRGHGAKTEALGLPSGVGDEKAGRRALHEVSFDVKAGEIFGILGPNGGGKTTLFRILSTLLRPSAGRASVFGHDVVAEAPWVRRQLGVVFQMPSLDVKLTAGENLRHQGHLYGLRGAGLEERIGEVLDVFDLGARVDEYVETFSGGMRRRVELAKALLHRPRLLLLDEPSTGLDPGARHDLWGHLTKLRSQQHITILLTTHLMDEAEHCDRLAVVNQGRLVALDRPAKLKAMIGGDVLTIQPASDPGSLCRRIAERFGPWAAGKAPRAVEGFVSVERENGAEFVAALFGAFPGEISSVTVGPPTLQDVFLHVTGHSFEQGGGG